MSDEIFNAISIIFNGIIVLLTLAGVIFGCVQLWQIKINRKRQFIQCRREKTVELVIHYTKSISDETKHAERVVSFFSDEQCRDLYNCNPITIDKSIKEKFCTICPYKKDCEKLETGALRKCEVRDNEFCIKDASLYYLRGHIINYLNSLESVLLAWQLGIVEQDVIEEQFMFLNKKSQRERALETFRTIAGGGHSYPAIEKFYQHLSKKENDKAKETLKEILQ